MFVALCELTLVCAATRPAHQSLAMHLVPHPCANIVPAVWPNIATITIHFVARKVALVHAPLAPHELTVAMFSSLHKLPVEDGTITPAFLASAILTVVQPTPLVTRASTTSELGATDQTALTVFAVVLELSLVHRPIGIDVL